MHVHCNRLKRVWKVGRHFIYAQLYFYPLVQPFIVIYFSHLKMINAREISVLQFEFPVLIAAGVMQIALMTTEPEFRFLAVKFFRPDSFLVSAVSLSLASFESVVLLVELGK